MALKQEVEINFRKADYWKIMSAQSMFQRNKTSINIFLFDSEEYRQKLDGNLRQFAVDSKNVIIEGTGYTIEELYVKIKEDEFFANAVNC